MRTVLLALALLGLALPARAQDAVLLLDASNSTSGRSDGRPRIEVMREAAAELLRHMPRGMRLGLMAFGHRHPGDCADVELLARPGAANTEALGRLDGLSPRGLSPIAGGITEASRVASKVILVTDGAETCAPDPCAVIRQARARNGRLQVNIVGFDVPGRREWAQLGCIAAATGGRLVPAANADDLPRAIAEAAGAAPRRARPGLPGAPPRVPPVTTLELEATEEPGGPLMQVGSWTLLSLTDPPRTVLSGTAQAKPRLRIPSGRYELRVSARTMRLVERFDVTGPTLTHRVVMNPGTLKPEGGLVAGAPPRSGVWTILAEEVSGYRPGEEVATSITAQPTFRLVQGSYRVRFEAGEAVTEALVFLPAAATVPVRLDLGAGEVTLSALHDGKPVKADLWEMHRQGLQRPIVSFGDVAPRVVLQAGEWRVRARVDNVWYEAALSLAPGQAANLTIAVP
jgi:Ca-activated chloride channel family protein